MPKAKPVSLFPLSFEQAIDALIRFDPKQKPKSHTKLLKQPGKKRLKPK